jgi:GNAT superfamily N-acetyltransferase
MGGLPGLSIRVPTEADIPAMVPVLVRAFGTWPRFPDPAIPPEDHLRWKFNNHEIARKIHQIAELEGRIISLRLRLMQTVVLRGQPFLLRQPVDDVVDPDYQGQGVNRAVSDYFEEHLKTGEVSWSFSTSVTAPKRPEHGYRTLGRELLVLYRALGVKSLWVSDPPGVGESFPRRVRVRGVLRALGAAARPARIGAIAIRSLERFPEAADRLFEHSLREFDWILLRTASSLNWRYAHPSAGRFAIRAAFEKDELIGYCVVRVGGPCAHIADLLVLPGRTDVADALVVDALEVAAGSGANAMVCWLVSDHPYFDLVRGRGFVVTGSTTGCLVRGDELEPDALDFLDRPETRVHVTAGDSDWV